MGGRVLLEGMAQAKAKSGEVQNIVGYVTGIAFTLVLGDSPTGGFRAEESHVQSYGLEIQFHLSRLQLLFYTYNSLSLVSQVIIHKEKNNTIPRFSLIGKIKCTSEVKWKITFSGKIPGGKKMFLRNRWYLRASSLLAFDTKAMNFMPTIKLVFPVKWQTPQSHGSQRHC